jgi:hypothetical protein
MSFRLWQVIFGLGCLMLTRAFPARAEAPGTFSLEWLAPADCPSSRQVEAEIARLLGGPAHGPAGDDLRVRASVGHNRLWSVTLETSSGTSNGRRTLSATTCEGLANATALIVALIIDPNAVAEHSREAEKTEQKAPATPVAEPPTAPRARTINVLAGLGATGSLGALPSPDLGLGAGLGLSGPLWRIEARVAYSTWWVKSSTMVDPAGAYGRFRLLTAMLAGCLISHRSSFDWGACLDFESGAVQGEGVGVTMDSAKTTPWLGLGAGGFLALRATPWLLFPFHIDAIVPLWRPDFTFEGVESPIFRARAVGGRMTAGIEFQF